MIDINRTRFIPMTIKHAEEIIAWQYDGIYSFYNCIGSDTDEFMNGFHFACLDENDVLIGMFAFGESCRIPTVETHVYDADLLDIGLKMRPDLCGHGLGTDFIRLGLSFARERFGTENFRLSVAAFNERAIKVYTKVGFHKKRDVTNSYFQNKFYIMTLKNN